MGGPLSVPMGASVLRGPPGPVDAYGVRMGWFSKKPTVQGTFRVVSATPLDGVRQLVLNGVPQRRIHVAGLVEAADAPPEAYSFDGHFDADQVPAVGVVAPCEILHRSPMKVRITWGTPRTDQRVAAAFGDADAAVVQQLMTTGRMNHEAGETDPLGIALTDPTASGTIADQLAAALGTPITVDVDEGGVQKHLTVGGGGHLSSADAAQLQQTGAAAIATITGATRVLIPQQMLPGPDASLWDLALHVVRADGSSYEAQTRVGFRIEARRHVLGEIGLTIPVRIDPSDDGRVALDSATFTCEHPDAPAG
jgi:hypothetical protein